MTRMKVVAAFVVAVGALGTLAASATPALAQFEVAAKSGEGQAKVTGTVLDDEGVRVTCGPRVDEYQSQSSGNPKEHGVGTKEVLMNPGVQLWKRQAAQTCVMEVLLLKVPVKLSECQMVFEQPNKGETKVTVSIGTECKLESTVCNLILPKVEESSGENFKLKSATLENKGSNLLISAAVEGITVKASGKSCPVSNNKVGKFTTSEPIVQEGAKAI